jgi:hypothetical protein
LEIGDTADLEVNACQFNDNRHRHCIGTDFPCLPA